MLAILPLSVALEIRTAAARCASPIHELRFTSGVHAVLVCGNRNIVTDVLCDDALLQAVLLALCGGSLYAHGETIREGFLYSEIAGVRVGVCGHAVVRDGRVERVSPVTSLAIRIPARYPGTYNELLPLIVHGQVPRSTLIWSPPGVGKTTALRELTLALSEKPYGFRCALIDTRYELAPGIQSDLLCVYSGYPRASGMEMAVRTMSPQIVVCDEIAGTDDACAALECAMSGAAVLASTHASDEKSLAKRPSLCMLFDAGVFPLWVGLEREGNTVRFHTVER